MPAQDLSRRHHRRPAVPDRGNLTGSRSGFRATVDRALAGCVRDPSPKKLQHQCRNLRAEKQPETTPDIRIAKVDA
jgi:hypothetical protein